VGSSGRPDFGNARRALGWPDRRPEQRSRFTDSKPCIMTRYKRLPVAVCVQNVTAR